jgi:cell division protein ZapD
VILFEHPFNERVRTYLRLEHLFDRFEKLIGRDEALDHHFCFTTLFEIIEVGGRTDLKTDMLKDLDRHRLHLMTFRTNASVDQQVLENVLSRIDSAFENLNGLGSKINQLVGENDFLSSLRNRISIPGGTCGFDLPIYHAWQQKPAALRKEHIERWTEPLEPLKTSVDMLLGLMRDNASAQKVSATAGVFQQNLPQGKFQLLRLFIDPALNLIPEISGNRMMVSIRLMQQDADGRLQACNNDTTLELALCS